jgi:hypothetical protein
MILVIDRRHDRPWASILVRSILKDFLLSIDYFRGRPDARHCRGAGLPLSSHLYPEVSAHLLRVSQSTGLARTARMDTSVHRRVSRVAMDT